MSSFNTLCTHIVAQHEFLDHAEIFIYKSKAKTLPRNVWLPFKREGGLVGRPEYDRKLRSGVNELRLMPLQALGY